MQSKPKSNSTITHSVIGNVVRFQVRGKPTSADAPGPVLDTMELDLSAVHESHHRRAELHGWIQRISDAAAISRVVEGGVEMAATPMHKAARMRRLIEHYMSGSADWSPMRERSGIGSDEALLARVMAEAYPDRSEEQVRSYVAARTAAERRALLESAKLKPIADRMRAERTQDIDAEALLADF